jgi:hypothetical protein
VGAIYLHSDLTAATAHLSDRASVHLVLIVSAMSRTGQCPHLEHSAVIDLIASHGTSPRDDREPEDVLAELVSNGLFTDQDETVSIGPRLAGLVSNTEPPDYRD